MKILPLAYWLLGLVTPLLWQQLPALTTLLWLLAAALLLWWWGWRALAIYLFGLCWCCFTAAPATLAITGPNHSIEGQVLAAKPVLYVRIFALDGQRLASPVLARLGWYLDSPRPLPGQQIAAAVKLRPVHHRLNPGSRAAARRDAAMGLAWVGYVKQPFAVRGQADWRYRWHQWLRQKLAGFNNADVMMALLSGQRQDISAERRQWLHRTGTAHLLAISGLHVSLVALLGLWAGHLLPGNGRRWGAWLGLALAAAYAWQSGLAPSTLRALVALAAWVLWLGWRRPVLALRLWLALLCLFGTVAPLTLLDSRLWLSFAAVALILLVLWRFSLRGWRLLVAIQLGLTLLMWPLQWWLFGAVPSWSLVANLLAVPLVSLLVMPLLLTGLAVPGLWYLADGLLSGLMHFLAWLPVGFWPPALLVLLMLAPLWWLPLRLPARLAAMVTVGLLWQLKPSGEPGVWFLDVGQGSATALVAANNMVLVDTGPGLWATDGARALQASRQLDWLLLSHSDRDHSGGAAAFNAPTLAGQPQPGQQSCWQQSLRWQGTTLQVLWPPGPLSGSDNDSSCVLYSHWAGYRVLLPGDISQLVERRLNWPQVDLLAAPHHGSASSSSAYFVASTRPRWVIFSTGFANHYGFPRPEVQRRYRAQGAALWDTGQQGALFCSAQGCTGLRRFWWEAWRHWPGTLN
ncbi:DNA internalization-related competence protein ComEC/Rec2 [Gallaecimonas sp. GXIMD1310]|uniref:DNA internalization-related competence protein ComEC/Rec2 n=1 Tax=Gallaecimonas sp. GXIMD1310 TaxID=3131926 RepID=UPI003247D2A9